ncbi:MAG: thiamine pyrophosphate-dependent dehydrogenase E1 component subunit alpha [Steroidobacteraceae bacterium]
MTLLKLHDERFRSLLKAGRVAMPYYSWRGQEAIPAGLSAALQPDDYICTIYRGLHDALARGIPLRELWAELFGKATGTCKGKGGPMHITHPKSGVMVTTGVVGSSMPIANGLALASQIAGDGRVTVAAFGDGATNIGAFHESLNLASIWKLPVVFLCSNNLYSEHTKFENATAVDRIADRAAAYRMPGVRIDGNDPLAVYAAAKLAIARARNGDGPTLIEAMTFRFYGHVFGDQDAYMGAGEKAAAMDKDPVPAYRHWLITGGKATEAELAAIESEILSQIDDAEQFAFASPFPELRELGTDIYAGQSA